MPKQPRIAILPKAVTVPNVYRVPKGFWSAWSFDAKRVFNGTYEMMRHDQTMLNHPKAAVMPQAHWNTVAWNAAVIAAEAL
jgi:hypothetical protein